MSLERSDSRPERPSADSPRVGDEMETDLGPVELTGLAAGGDAVGRLADGRVVFVEGGLPGERVRLDSVRPAKRFVRARAAKIERPSPDRVEPRCPHFGACGGCRWQHLRYPAQVEAKRNILRDALERIGGFRGGVDFDPDFELVASPRAYGYRARARFVASKAGPGFRAYRSRLISPIEACPVLVPHAEAGLRDVVSRRSTVESGEWLLTAGSSADVLVVPARSHTSSRRSGDVDPTGEATSISLEVAGETLRVSGRSFVQANALLWEPLVAAVVRACLAPAAVRLEATDAAGQQSRPGRFAELYAGIGFFTVPLARAGARGVAIESDRSALADLRSNLRAAGLGDRVEIVPERVERLRDLRQRLDGVDWLLADPPRVGLEVEVCRTIAETGPARFVYLSCDPATLARDLKRLVDAGYAIETLQGFDLFPQTPHVECLVRLTRTRQGSIKPWRTA